MSCIPVLYRWGLVVVVRVRVCVCLCVCVCVLPQYPRMCGRVLSGRCCALWCADGACRASSFPYGTRVHCPVHVRRVFVFALSVYLQFRRRTVGECRSYCRHAPKIWSRVDLVFCSYVCASSRVVTAQSGLPSCCVCVFVCLCTVAASVDYGAGFHYLSVQGFYLTLLTFQLR